MSCLCTALSPRKQAQNANILTYFARVLRPPMYSNQEPRAQLLAKLYRTRETCVRIIAEAEAEGDFHDAREFTKTLESIDQQIWRNGGRWR